MKDHSPKKLLLCIAIICAFAGSMQVYIFKKRQSLHFKHHPDMRFSERPQDSFVPSGAPVEGTVAAIGMDRIHLSYGTTLTPFRCESPGQYKIGEKLRITFAQGSPPTAIKIDRLP